MWRFPFRSPLARRASNGFRRQADVTLGTEMMILGWDFAGFPPFLFLLPSKEGETHSGDFQQISKECTIKVIKVERVHIHFDSNDSNDQQTSPSTLVVATQLSRRMTCWLIPNDDSYTTASGSRLLGLLWGLVNWQLAWRGWLICYGIVKELWKLEVRKSVTYVDVYTCITTYIMITLATVVSILFRVRPDIAWQRQF